MTPFRQKPIKWDGEDGNGRYEEKNGFKYDILAKTTVKKTEEMPKCFLADTPEEAEVISKQFNKLLNDFAYSYAISTGLNKADLFGEALIGLARAYRDWDPERSDKFRTYAAFRIKDTLGEFVRENTASVSVPAYVKKAHSNLVEVRSICESYNIDHKIILEDQELPDKLETADAMRCTQLVKNLINAAKRAKVEYTKFIERVVLIPEDTEYVDQTPPEVHKRDMEMLEAAVIVDKLKEYMTPHELTICEGIMLDESFEQIGLKMGKSKGWVSGKLKTLRERIVGMMKDGTL